ncbi:hypothetical protein FK216_10215 [Moraxellaceae bacterium AER2_44_116]|nr:SIR2 family protein [Moraxellaceae bacterium]TQC97259.1 hypothetical protein FK216_10215 [Moraxellaceae bacterium AER2_44_116]
MMKPTDLTSDSVIFLLGAGASVDAKIPHAAKMVKELEREFQGDYKKLRPLYLLLKSAILFQRGLDDESPSTMVGVEDILNVIEELKKKHKNVLYPYIGTWSYHLTKVAGNDFENIIELDRLIRNKLYEWVANDVKSYAPARYLSKIVSLAKEIAFKMRIFTLNYDLCLEKSCEELRYNLEVGFNKNNSWSDDRFIDGENSDVDAYLYKLHGSIDWVKNEEIGLPERRPQAVNNAQLIFGTSVKMNSLDPYLYYIYEFRKYTKNKDLRFMIIVGYSFSDDHINNIITQALKANTYLKLIVVTYIAESDNAELAQEKDRVCKKIQVDNDRVIWEIFGAKLFLEEKLTIDYLVENLTTKSDLPF